MLHGPKRETLPYLYEAYNICDSIIHNVLINTGQRKNVAHHL